MKRRRKKTLEKIGNDYYGFRFQLEKNIYCYLCCKHGKRIEVYRGIRFCKLDEEQQFNTYHQWRQYVYNKYCNYTTEKLSDFSRYLNQMIRDRKPNRENGIIVITAVLTLLFSKLYEKAEKYLSYILGYKYGLGIIVMVFACMVIAILISQITFPVFDNSIEENFFRDYKEIIDDILSEKK